MRKIVNTVLIVVSLILVVGLLLDIGAETNSQEQRRPRGANISLSSEEIPHLVEIIRVWKLVDELGLNEEQLVKFLPKFKELNDLRSRYYGDRRETVNEISKLLEANASEDQLKPIADKFTDAEVNYYQTYNQLNDTLNANLTVKQRAKFIVFQDRYRSDIRRLIRTLRELSDQREPRSRPQPTTPQEKKD
ncbi:hypothetical protein ACFL6S_22565 [Candidatus Poribacteria bacterium]